MKLVVKQTILKLPNLHTEPGVLELPDDALILGTTPAYNSTMGSYLVVTYATPEEGENHD